LFCRWDVTYHTDIAMQAFFITVFYFVVVSSGRAIMERCITVTGVLYVGNTFIMCSKRFT
jgi:hypothetical protein